MPPVPKWLLLLTGACNHYILNLETAQLFRKNNFKKHLHRKESTLRIAKWLVQHRKIIVFFYALAVAISLISAQHVKTNFDMSQYLPKETDSVKGIELNKAHFGQTTSARLLLPQTSLSEASLIKTKLEALSGIEKVIWLDDFTQIEQPTEIISQKLKENYYRDDRALFYIYFEEGDFSKVTAKALESIKSCVSDSLPNGEKAWLYGSPSANQEVVSSASSSGSRAGMILIPLVLIILLFATSSWIEPFLFLVNLGVVLILNQGTNIWIDPISFITQSMSVALLLAISMDYAIFLLHRFADARHEGLSVEDAMTRATVQSFSAIVASATTTIAGFAALLLMQFSIGFDMGLVFAKGITISLIATLTLMPALGVIFAPLIEKTHHASFMPSFLGFGRWIYKLRYISIVLVLLLAIPAFLAQQQNTYIYGGSAISEASSSVSAQSKLEIETIYGSYNPLILLIPSGQTQKEAKLIADLEGLSGVVQVHGLANQVDTRIPKALLPDQLTTSFEAGKFSRLIVVINTPEEGTVTFKLIDDIKEKAKLAYGDEVIITGNSASLYDIKSVSGHDQRLVNWVAIVAVMIIILLTFKSVVLPFILVLCIQVAIWINMSIPYFTSMPLSFVGMLMVGAIQLGATIDYAILLTGSYQQHLDTSNIKDAIINSIDDAGGSILTSGIVLTLSGLMIRLTSPVQTVREMGTLIGRGAFLSTLFVLIALPAFLAIYSQLKRSLNHD